MNQALAESFKVPTGVAVVALSLTGAINWLLLGYWARWSLRGPMALSAQTAVNSMRDKWLTGAIILALGPIVVRRLLAVLPGTAAPPSLLRDISDGSVALVVLGLGALAMSHVSAHSLRSAMQRDADPIDNGSHV